MYRFIAEKANAKFSLGTIRAPHTKQALEALQQRFATVHLLEKLPSFSPKSLFGARMSLVEKIVFVKNLYVMLKAGVPLDEAFQLIELQSPRAGVRKVTKSIVANIRGGKSLSTAVASFGRIFNPFFVNMIYVGEKSGTLDANLQYLSKELEHTLDLRRKVRSASIYPTIILTMTLILAALMIRFVLPQLIKVFDSINIALPPQTRVFLDSAAFAQQYGAHVAVGLILFVVAIRLVLALSPSIHLVWSRAILRIPLIGLMVESYNLAQITRTLAVLLQSGTPLTDALEITAKATDNLHFKLELIQARKGVIRGQALGDTLSKLRFNRLVSQLITMGERSGNLESNLLYLSDFYNNRIDYMTKDLPLVLEPALLIIVGLSVAFLATSILSPIYEFTTSVGR